MCFVVGPSSRVDLDCAVVTLYISGVGCAVLLVTVVVVVDLRVVVRVRAYFAERRLQA